MGSAALRNCSIQNKTWICPSPIASDSKSALLKFEKFELIQDNIDVHTTQTFKSCNLADR